MASALSIILALSLASEPPVRPPSANGIAITAALGFSLVGFGVGYELSARAGPAEFALHAEANTVGGVGLMSMGLCLLLIAAVLTEWRFPARGPLVLGAQWP